MQTLKIDLYKEFNIPRPEKAKGFLYAYIIDAYPELNAKRTFPAMLVIPGGGYEFVSQREAEPVALQYVANHFCGFVLDYSIAPDCHYPTALLEAAMSMLYIRNNASALNVTADKVAAVGFSAGGHLCGCLATMFDSEPIVKAFGAQSCAKVRPDAVVLSYAVISCDKTFAHIGSFKNLMNGDEARYAEVSLENNVTAASSPAFIWHTFDDNGVPVKNSLVMAAKYNEYKVPFELHIFEEGWHGLSVVDDSVFKVKDTPDFNCKFWLKLSVKWLIKRGFAIKDNI